ncbi:MAG: hypothetical protein ACKO24_11285 [Leptolyngbyaceae cyanobacterium]
MGIAIGIYDFFSHAIPGGVVVAAILYLLQRDLLLSTNHTSLSVQLLIILGTLSYILGYVLDPFSLFWYRIFSPKNHHKKVIEDLDKNLLSVEINLQDIDWYTLLAFVKRNNMHMSQDVERFNVTSIMLRKVSLGMLIFAFIFSFEFIFINRLPMLVFLGVFCLVTSIVLIKESVKFKSWFYAAIYQSVAALVAEPKNLPVKFKSALLQIVGQ